jgi:hypothetical protein
VTMRVASAASKRCWNRSRSGGPLAVGSLAASRELLAISKMCGYATSPHGEWVKEHAEFAPHASCGFVSQQCRHTLNGLSNIHGPKARE